MLDTICQVCGKSIFKGEPLYMSRVCSNSCFDFLLETDISDEEQELEDFINLENEIMEDWND